MTNHYFTLAVSKLWPKHFSRRIERLISRGDFNAAINELENLPHDRSSQQFMCIPLVSVEGAGCDILCTTKPANTIEEPALNFLDEKPILTSVTDRRIPAQYVARVTDCIAHSGAGLIIRQGKALYDIATLCRGNEIDYYDSDELRQARLIRHTSNGKMILDFPAAPPAQIEAGICMFGIASRNYGHWILEHLPKMLNFKDAPIPSHIPIYIDGGMPSSHLETLDRLNFMNREIREIPKGPCHFQNLYVSSPIANSPVDILPGNPMHDTIWPKDTFLKLRDALFAKMASPSQRQIKVFLSRKNYKLRRLLNESEIAAHLSREGFEVVEPENLTFDQQVEVFRSADIIVGSCSSALTNTLFCKPGCKVVGLIHDTPSFNFRSYASLIECSGAKPIFVRGESVKSDGKHPYHLDYSVPIDRVVRACELPPS
ncbi:glycosyltransferase family 61 protein [Afipia carboxidovorans]|uniref:glycosyltransferase family 61 protein n=1 Tax=Afipia carboxidovorans TaxID=40137 RepID=UPI0030CB0E97